MPSGNPEEVRMSHLHALDRRISDHRLEVSESLNDTIKQIVTPMNELTTEMKVSNQNHAHLKEDIDRISGITERNSKKIAEIDKGLAIVGTTQSGILGVGGKVLPFVFAGLGVLITALLSVSIYFKLSLGV
tara:strand:- start:22274 stop:22666 length:393 start_codon:yes stop_codon:yes gene_type:complete